MVICSGGWLDEAADLVWVIHKGSDSTRLACLLAPKSYG
jgi:hypothetical protein